jgi:predicted transcriptional regulator
MSVESIKEKRVRIREQATALINDGYKRDVVASMLGISSRTLRRYFQTDDIEIEDIPEEERSAEEILEDRKKEYSRREKARPSIIQMKVNSDGPIGITHFGDPHLDDPGTDLNRLEYDMDVVKNTDGMYGANVGDIHNNWVGRLQRLYAEQTVTAKESWKLVEWFIRKIDWLYLVGGNHDAWSGSNDPLYWLTKQHDRFLRYHGVRFNLKFPNKREVRINARHDFKGYSQWNPAHGPMKAIQMGWRDHILTCGHTHQSGIGVLSHPDASQRIISWAIRVPSYKILDNHAIEIGANGNFVSPTCTTIINPYAEREEGLVTVIWDLDTAADFLTFQRKKYGK